MRNIRRCEACGLHAATVHVAHVENDKAVRESHLCPSCAAKTPLAALSSFDWSTQNLNDAEKLLVAMKKCGVEEMRVRSDRRPLMKVRGAWREIGNRPLSSLEVLQLLADVNATEHGSPVSWSVPAYGTFLVQPSDIDGKPAFTAVVAG